MKKIISLFVMFLCAPVYAGQYRAALVADMDTGRVLFEENSNDLNYPASLTKIMTLYLTFDALEHGRLHLDDYLIVSNSAANAAPVKLGLPAGSKIRVEDAIKALAVHSANDVARVLAENLKGGQEESFASLMTRVAREIGLAKTNFENSSGLPDDDHLSTARDIALLSMAVYKHFPQYWKYFGIKNWTYNGKTYTNGNRLLDTFPGCDGMKTGYTAKSKYSLVATAKRDGHHLMSVVLGAENKDVRATESAKLLNNGFETLRTGGASVSKQSYKTPVAQNAPVVQKFAADYKKPNVSSEIINGKTGVQFGAFSNRNSANAQVARIKSVLGIDTVVENTENGLYRVRVYGLNENMAQQLKNTAVSNGIDSYVFH